MKKLVLALTMAVCAAALPGAPAKAADLPYKAAPAPVDPWNPWMIRLRALVVDPDAGGHVDQVPGSSFGISTSVVPELDITYFFNPNWAVEEILGVTRHNVTGAGTLAGTDIAKATLLPPTLTLQYHWTNFGAFKPYVGAGVNYTFFFDQKAMGSPVTQIDVKDSWGWALQAGFDYMFDKHWGWNVDVKKIFLRPDFSANNGTLTGKLQIDPWLIASGITYKF